MAKLPRIRRSPSRGRPQLPLLSSVRGRIITGFGVLVLMLVAVVVGSATLVQTHRSALAELEREATTADLLQDAQLDATFATLLLQRYAIAGTEEAIPVIRASAARVIDNIEELRTRNESAGDLEETAELKAIAAGSSLLVDTAEKVIALRRSGDVAGAATALEEAVPQLTQFGMELGEAADRHRGAVPVLRSRANRTAGLAIWLLVFSGVIGAGLGLAVSVAISHSILKPLSSLEATALAVAGGDLEARAPTTGPQELARLGVSLNQMTDSLLDASKRLELEAQRELALAQLRESEQKARAITDAATDAIITIDDEGKILHWNPASERMFGYTSKEAAGKELHLLIAPERYHHDCKEGLDRFRTTGQGPAIGKTLELSALNRDGAEFPVELSLSAVELAGKWNAIGVVRDITERKRMEEELREQVRRDPLTGVLNHAAIVDELRALVEKGSDQGASHAVAMVDVDGLKAVNDTYGHQAGDAVLVAVANALSRDGALVGRYGGDEFVAILPGADHESAKRYRRAVLNTLARTRLTDPESKASVPVVASVGLATYPEEANTVADLIKLSDSAMYASRQQRPIGQNALSPARPPGGHRAAEMVGQIVPLLTSPGKLEDKLRLVAHCISVRAGYDAVTIDTFTQPGGPPSASSSFANVPDEVIEAWRRARAPVQGEPYLRLLLRTRRPLIIEDPQNDERLSEIERSLARAAEMKSAVAVPLFWQDEMIGVLGAASKREAAFTSQDAQCLTAVASQVAAIVRMATLVEDLRSTSDRLQQARDETVMMLAAAAEAHDRTTGVHLQNVRALTEALARELSYSDADAKDLALAAVLHDIGKIRVPDAVLLNSSRLSEAEWAVVKQHTIWGAEFLAGRPGFELAAIVARSHHERWDGSGYPDGLAAEDIPEAAAIVAVADSFDAMTSDRPYRRRWSVAAAIREIISCSGEQFSPKVVEALARLHKRHKLPLVKTEDAGHRAAA